MVNNNNILLKPKFDGNIGLYELDNKSAENMLKAVEEVNRDMNDKEKRTGFLI